MTGLREFLNTGFEKFDSNSWEPLPVHRFEVNLSLISVDKGAKEVKELECYVRLATKSCTYSITKKTITLWIIEYDTMHEYIKMLINIQKMYHINIRILSPEMDCIYNIDGNAAKLTFHESRLDYGADPSLNVEDHLNSACLTHKLVFTCNQLRMD